MMQPVCETAADCPRPAPQLSGAWRRSAMASEERIFP
jgi:hypothetical protein